mmetsp:Transcript_34376/g.69394  ORF Transcript_34376/g.69394 Transcript_34376/m.69394 type:complete len:89 (-) Transcript_34376:902-1168(-)
MVNVPIFGLLPFGRGTVAVGDEVRDDVLVLVGSVVVVRLHFVVLWGAWSSVERGVVGGGWWIWKKFVVVILATGSKIINDSSSCSKSF